MLIFFCFQFICLYASSNSSFLSALQTSQVFHILMNAQLTHESIFFITFSTKFHCYASMRCPFCFRKKHFATLQRSRLRLVKKLTGESMHVNKLYFLKENTLFRNGIIFEIERRTAKETAKIRELTAKKFCSVRKLWFYQGDEQARGNLLAML